MPWGSAELSWGKGEREVPEPGAQGLILERVGDNFLVSKPYKPGESVRGLGFAGVCFCVSQGLHSKM